MTQREFERIPCNDYCPFVAKLTIKEHKKLKEIATLKNNHNHVYELHEKGDPNIMGILHNIKLEELVIADKRSYEGTFVKFFKTSFLNSLNTYALKIFVYITENLEVNNNKVILDIVKIELHCGIKEPRKIYDGLGELIEKHIIAKHATKDIYYVNPNIIFRGANRKILLTHKNY